MTWKLEVASNAAASSWTDVTALVDRKTFKIGGECPGGGSAGTGFGFDFADDAAAYEFPARRAVRFTIGSTVCGRGRVAVKDLARGMIWSGDARQFAVNFTDGNAHLQGIPVHGWIRPAETDVARITALCSAFLAGSPRVSTNLATTYLSSDGPVDLEARTYNNTNPAGVVAEVERIAGKLFFVTVDDEVFYDRVDSANYNAGLSVTDSAPNLTDHFPPIPDGPVGTQDGSEFYSGLGLTFGDPPATIYATDAAAESDHDYWHEVVNSEGSTTVEQATAELASLLEFRKVEEDRFRFAIRLTEAQVPLVKYGQNISFRAAAAGILSPITIRIARLVWEEYAPGIWLAHIENAKLSPRLGRGTRIGAPGGEPSMPGIITPFVDDASKDFWSFWGAWDPRLGAEPGFVYDAGAECGGHVYVAFQYMETFAAAGAVLVEPGCENLGGVYRIGSHFPPTDPDYDTYKNQLTDRIFYDFGAVGFTGVVHLNIWKITDSAAAPTTAHLRARPGSWSGTPATDIDLPAGTTYGIGAGYTADFGLVFTTGIYRYWSAALSIVVSGSRQMVIDSLDYYYTDGPFFVGLNTAAMIQDMAGTFTGGRPAGHPTAFVFVGVADGVTTAYTSPFGAYRPGTLEVLVGGEPWALDGFVETDPTTGDFTFTQIPLEGVFSNENDIYVRQVTA